MPSDHQPPSSQPSTIAELSTGTPTRPQPPAPNGIDPDTARLDFGRYRLIERLGEGGCGIVYVAEQLEPVRRRVALKLIRPGMDSKAVLARFEAERQALARMDHPNIARILDAGMASPSSPAPAAPAHQPTGQRPFFVMELVHGIPITEYCHAHRLLGPERLQLFIAVCHAVQHAHQKGIIHRDLKPSNVLVTLDPSNSTPRPKVIDFGVAKATDGRLGTATIHTQVHQLIGTPAYMSPEQAEMGPPGSADIDTRTDIYSLGVLLYELLTGVTPFDAQELLSTGVDTMRRTIREREPVHPSTRLQQLQKQRGASPIITPRSSHPPIPADLDWIVMKCLEKDRSRRFATASDLAADVARHLTNEPVLARPPSAIYKLHKTWIRNRLLVSAAAAVSLTLILGTVVSTWQALVATAARQQALLAQTAAENAAAAQAAERRRADAGYAEARQMLYTAQMRLAQQAWDQSTPHRLRQLLDDTAQWPDRGFEWFYWQKQFHAPTQILRGHLHAVFAVAFAPNSRHAATASADHTTKLWSIPDGTEQLSLEGHTDRVNAVTYAPDGLRIATGSDDRTLRVWSATTGTSQLILRGHDSPVTAVAWSPDGRSLLSSSLDGTARLWDAQSGHATRVFASHSGGITSVSFSTDGSRVLSVGSGPAATVWDIASGTQQSILHDPRSTEITARFSPLGSAIASAGAEARIRLWRPSLDDEIATLVGHIGAVRAVAFTRDGQRLASAGDDRTARLWDLNSNQELFRFKGHANPIRALDISADGRWLLTGSDDRTARLWDLTMPQDGLALNKPRGRIWSAALSPDGQRAVTGGDDRSARVFDAASGTELLALDGHTRPIRAVAFAPDGDTIATASEDRTAMLWDANTGRRKHTLLGHAGRVTAVDFSKDGRHVATGCLDRTARIWDTESGTELLTLAPHAAGVGGVAFSPDGSRLATASGESCVRLWELPAGRLLLTLSNFNHFVRSVAFSPDGTELVTAIADHTARIFDTATGRERLVLHGHSAPVESALYTPDGRRILTCSTDRTAKVWDATGGRELLTLEGHSDRVNALSCSRAGDRILTAGWDGVARLWQAARESEVAAWTLQEATARQRLEATQFRRATSQREAQLARAREEGSIKKWLVLLPIPLADEQSGNEALETQQILDEERLTPSPGATTTAGSESLVWRTVAQDHYLLDFVALLGRDSSWSIAYAVTYVWSDHLQDHVHLFVGSDDESKVYLNGRLVYASRSARGYLADQDQVGGLRLEPGRNTIVLKVVNGISEWKASIRLANENGQPLQGIRVATEPDTPAPSPAR